MQRELVQGQGVRLEAGDVGHFSAAALTQYQVDVAGLPAVVEAFKIGVYLTDQPGLPGIDANKAGQPFVVTTPFDGVKRVLKSGLASGDVYVRVLVDYATTVTLTKRKQTQRWGLLQAISNFFSKLFGGGR